MGEHAPTFDLVAVAENVPYLAWQAMLFHHSCVTTQGRVPIVAVHVADEGEELLDGFRRIADDGGRIQRLPTTRGALGFDYPALNTISALAGVASDADHLVLCDADLVFRRPLPLRGLRDDELTFDRVPYLRVTPRSRRHLARPCARAGVDLEALVTFGAPGGVPHVVPRALRGPLAREWLACMRCFVEPHASARAFPWESLMWALVLATVRLGLRPVPTAWGESNRHGERRLGAALDPHLVHYCYGDRHFDKRSFGSAASAERVWEARAESGTLHGVVCEALAGAARHFGLGPAASSMDSAPGRLSALADGLTLGPSAGARSPA